MISNATAKVLLFFDMTKFFGKKMHFVGVFFDKEPPKTPYSNSFIASPTK